MPFIKMVNSCSLLWINKLLYLFSFCFEEEVIYLYKFINIFRNQMKEKNYISKEIYSQLQEFCEGHTLVLR